MSQVKFTEMKNGSKEDYLLLDKHEKKFAENTGERLLKFMSTLDDTLEGYRVCLLYTSPSPRDLSTSRMPSSA